MRGVFAGTMLLLFASMTATADTPPSPTTEAIVQTAPAEGDAAKLICKTDRETGSRVKKTKVCKTKQEWDDMRESSRKKVDEYGKQSPANPLPSS